MEAVEAMEARHLPPLLEETEMTFREQIDDINYEIEQLEFKKDALLRKAGWEYKCDVGALWLWVKDVPGRGVLRVDKASAIWLQEYFEEVKP